MNKKCFLLAMLVFQNITAENIVFSGNSSSSSIQKTINTTIGYDGLLDQAFGSSGRVGSALVQNAPGGLAYAMVIQDDGKIVLAGAYLNNFAVARFLPNGSLDDVFGVGNPGMITPGFVIIPGSIANGSTIISTDKANSVVVQQDGKIVVGGFTHNNSNNLDCFALARFLPNGNLDTTFLNENTVIPGAVFIPTCLTGDNSATSEDYIYGITIDQDGKIVCAGYSYDAYADTTCFALARFLSTGQPDTTFGKNTDTTKTLIPGTVFIQHSIATGGFPIDEGYAVAIQSDEKIVVGGLSYLGLDYKFAVARFMSDGTLDSSFGVTSPNSKIPGTVYIPGPLSPGALHEKAYALVLQPDGKIVLAGSSAIHYSDYYGVLVRVTSDGNLDITFGANNPSSIYPGSIYISSSMTGATSINDQITALALQSDGALVAGGTSQNNGSYNLFAVARFTPEGMPDLSFGKANPNSLVPGTLYIPALIHDSTHDDDLNALAIQSDGKIVLGGYATDSFSNYYFTVVRLFNPLTFASYQAAYTSVGAGVNC